MSDARLAASSVSLAECQSSAIGPAPIAVAIHIATAIARAVHAAHQDVGGGARGLSPSQVRMGHDGSVALTKTREPSAAGHVSPEELSGHDLDPRADVFSLGVVLWELLTGTRLFERGSETATSTAILEEEILDVRAVNPEVPDILADVLATALARDRTGRFETAEAFANALAGARSSSGIREASAQDVAQWVAERVPRASAASSPSAAGAVPDLDMPGASRAHRSHAAMNAVSAPSAPATGRGTPQAPPSVRTAVVDAFAKTALASNPRSPVAFPSSDADDFDMEIERNLVAGPPMASSPGEGSYEAGRTSGAHAARISTAGFTSGSGLELGAQTRASSRSSQPPREVVGFGAKLGGFLAALVILGGVAAALFRFAHHAGGLVVTRARPHAFDGTSSTESGAVAVVALVVAVVLAFAGLRLKPHAWTIVTSGGTMLLLALAMVTVTLASTGESPTPPDGVLLVPYLVPLAIALLALGVGLRAARRFAHGRGGAKLLGVPLAAFAGALAFAALELSRFAP